ncbi:MAG: hypothetical protein AAGM45_22725, partial [Cyanobacteria bacterium J06588_5]
MRKGIREGTSQQLFRRSRLWLAFWYALVTGGILGLSGVVMYRVLMQSRWVALEREIESIAGTLHDSLEPMLPVSAAPTTERTSTRLNSGHDVMSRMAASGWGGGG